MLRYPERLLVEPFVPIHEFIDAYGNRVGRLVAPAGKLRFYYDNYAVDNGEPEPSIEGPRSTPWSSCLTTASSSCSPAGIAKSIA